MGKPTWQCCEKDCTEPVTARERCITHWGKLRTKLIREGKWNPKTPGPKSHNPQNYIHVQGYDAASLLEDMTAISEKALRVAEQMRQLGLHFDRIRLRLKAHKERI